MVRLPEFWVNLCLLRARPQDLPASRWLSGLSLGGYLLVSLLSASAIVGLADGILIALLDCTLLCTFVALALYLTGRMPRLLQTLSALAGAGTVLGLPGLLLMQVSQSTQLLDAHTLSLVWLLLLCWNLVVTAHILRHALSSSFATGIAVALLYILVSTRLIISGFPELAG